MERDPVIEEYKKHVDRTTSVDYARFFAAL
jgi:hypothetical protein